MDKMLKELFAEIASDGSFTDEFVDFSKDSVVIFMMCKMYEKGTGKLITKESLEDEINILSFIKDISPLMKKMSSNHELSIDEKLRKELIEKIYIPHVRDKLQENANE